MGATIRGAAAHRGPLLLLTGLTTVVVAGVVTVAGVAARAGTSSLAAIPLLALGLYAVPGCGQELASGRRAEIGLARLRGLEGPRLVGLLAREPLLALVAGALLGLAVGLVGTRLFGEWVGAAGGFALPAGWVIGVVLLIVLVGLAGVLVGMHRVVREELATQVSIAERPRPASAAAVFGGVFVVVIAIISLYRSRRGGVETDWLVLTAPALVGLAVAELNTRLLRVVGRVETVRTRTRPIAGFLAARRLGRIPAESAATRLLVAAAVVAAVALTAAASVAQWRTETGRLRAGAALVIPLDLTAHQALELSHGLDPQGRWLMAAVLVPDPQLQVRRAFVETGRVARVMGDTLAPRLLADLAAATSSQTPWEPIVGDRLTVGPATSSVAGPDLRVSVGYLAADGGTPASQAVIVRGPRLAPRSVPSPGCRRGCRVTWIRIEIGRWWRRLDRFDTWAHPVAVQVDLDGLELGGTDLTALPWSAPPGSGTVTRTATGLRFQIPADAASMEARSALADRPLPVLATSGLRFPDAPVIKSPGGDVHPAEVLARARALPLVEGAGLLADLELALAGSAPTVPAAQPMLLARADTPPAVLHRGRLAGLLQTRAEIGAAAADRAGAAQSRVLTLVGGWCLALAVVAMGMTVTRQRARYRDEVTVLRLLGVPASSVRAAAGAELAWIAGTALVATLAGAALAARMLLPSMPLLRPEPYAVPLVLTLRPGALLGVAVVLCAVIVVIGGWVRRAGGPATAPARLRDGVGR